MTTTLRFHPRILAVFAVPAIALAVAGARALDAPPDAAGVLEAEQGWLHAEFVGNTAYLRRLLLPEYRTVSWHGARDRDGIFASALRHAANHDVEPAYRAPEVELRGMTAIATFTIPDSSSNADVFVFEHGSWHAYYSQHTMLTPATAAK